MAKSKAKKSVAPKVQEVLLELLNSVQNLTVRFPLEGFAQNGKCKCLQYEDNGDCRHLFALEAQKNAEAFLKAHPVKR